MASKKIRQNCRKLAHPLNYLEGQYIIFKTGEFAGKQVTLDKRSKKGIWDVSIYQGNWQGWYYTKMTDGEILANIPKGANRETQLNKILI